MKKKRSIALFLVAVLCGVCMMFASCTKASTEAAAVASVTSLAGIWICFIVVASLVGLALFVLWIIMLIDCIKRKPEDFPNGQESEKTTWTVILIVSFFVMNLNGIAAIVYYFMVRKKRPISW